MNIYMDLKYQTVSKRSGWFSKETRNEHRLVAVSVIKEGTPVTFVSTDFDEKEYSKTAANRDTLKAIKGIPRLSNQKILEELTKLLGKKTYANIISSGLYGEEAALFHLWFGNKLEISHIRYNDLQEVAYDYEGGVGKIQPPSLASQHYDPARRATWLMFEFQALERRKLEDLIESYRKIAHESHRGLMDYIRSKSKEDEQGNIVIPKSNYDKWHDKSHKPYFTLNKSQRTQYIVEADKYIKALYDGFNI